MFEEKTGQIQTSRGGAVQSWQSREEGLVHLNHWWKERREKKRRNRAQQNGKKVTANRTDCSEDTAEIKRSSR